MNVKMEGFTVFVKERDEPSDLELYQGKSWSASCWKESPTEYSTQLFAMSQQFRLEPRGILLPIRSYTHSKSLSHQSTRTMLATVSLAILVGALHTQASPIVQTLNGILCTNLTANSVPDLQIVQN